MYLKYKCGPTGNGEDRYKPLTPWSLPSLSMNWKSLRVWIENNWSRQCDDTRSLPVLTMYSRTVSACRKGPDKQNKIEWQFLLTLFKAGKNLRYQSTYTAKYRFRSTLFQFTAGAKLRQERTVFICLSCVHDSVPRTSQSVTQGISGKPRLPTRQTRQHQRGKHQRHKKEQTVSGQKCLWRLFRRGKEQESTNVAKQFTHLVNVPPILPMVIQATPKHWHDLLKRMPATCTMKKATFVDLKYRAWRTKSLTCCTSHLQFRSWALQTDPMDRWTWLLWLLLGCQNSCRRHFYCKTEKATSTLQTKDEDSHRLSRTSAVGLKSCWTQQLGFPTNASQCFIANLTVREKEGTNGSRNSRHSVPYPSLLRLAEI